jgi:hypothetical protein
VVKIGAEGEGQATDVIEINRPDDLGDIADLDLTPADAKLLAAGLQQEILTAQASDHAVRRPANRVRHQLWRYYPQMQKLTDDLAAPWFPELWAIASTPAKAGYASRRWSGYTSSIAFVASMRRPSSGSCKNPPSKLPTALLKRPASTCARLSPADAL